MGLENLYEEALNPLDNPDFLDTAIRAYLKDNGHSFYSRLVKSNVNKKYPNQYKVQDKDELYSLLFNEWKKRITSMSRREFEELKKRNLLDDSFIKLRNYLINVPDANTFEEVNNIIHSTYQDRVLDSAMDKYRFTAFGEGSSWSHISSNVITTYKDPYFPIYHRLYLNTEGIDTYRLVIEFTKKCLERNIPYYYKFNEYADRQDNVVVYSGTDHLYDFIEILREIKEEQKEVINPLEPPFMSSSIDGWIGYGSDPERKPNGELQSFNEKRADMLELAIKEATFRWMDKNPQATFTKNGKTKTLERYFSDKCAYYLIEDLKERYNRLVSYRGEEEIVKRLGYTLEDLDNPIVKRNISKEISNRMQDIRNKKEFAIEMEVRDEKTIKFTEYHLEQAMKRLIQLIGRGRKEEYKQILGDTIKEMCPENNISINNFAFDLSAIRRINKEITRQQRGKTKVVNKTPKNNDLEQMFEYKEMTDQEIREAQEKLGFVIQ